MVDTPTFLWASLLQYHEQQRHLQKKIDKVCHTSLYCRDYVPFDILPSDVGGDKNAPLMVSLPHDSFLNSPQNERSELQGASYFCKCVIFDYGYGVWWL